jgi:DNA-binding Xre family transcriptional regulator
MTSRQWRQLKNATPHANHNKNKGKPKRKNKGANVLYNFLKKYCKELKVDPKELIRYQKL